MRAPFALFALSIACLVTFSATHAPLADYLLSATPWALLGWAGLASAVVAAALGRGRLRALAGGLALLWVALWILTFSDVAQDALAVVRRTAFAFVAF